MTKYEFLAALEKALSGLPEEDIQDRLTFYSEMIDDRKEEGISEEEVISQLGSVEEIARQIISETPLIKIVKKKMKPKQKLKPWMIVLIVLGSPIWLSLGIAAISVILSLYVALWSVVVSLWAVFAAFVGVAVGGVASGVGAIVGGQALSGVWLIGCGLACAGLAIFLFFGCAGATKGSAWLGKRVIVWIKNCFVKKEKTDE